MSTFAPFIAQPLHMAFSQHYQSGSSLRAATERPVQVMTSTQLNSVSPDSFNALLCMALNRRESHGITHFAMLHGDISAQSGWLDILHDEEQATGADIISTVVPLKNTEGFTSTGIGYRDESGIPQTVKLTMQDVFCLPETFTIDDTPEPDKCLLLNTGCWMFDIRKPWVDEFMADGGFQFETWIERDAKGNYVAQALSEDWHLSLWAHERRLKQVVTRKVKLKHFGVVAFGNDAPWGQTTLHQIHAVGAV